VRSLAWIIHEPLLRQSILSPGVAFVIRSPRRTAMDRLIKNRPHHHLGGAHRRGALYSARRAPCEKPMENRVLARRRGRVK
jgi:hypothetical protein